MKHVYTRFFLVVFFLCASSLHANLNTEITYGQAMQHAQQGDWEQAHSQLNQLVTDNPERADILYDSGVAAYRLKNFESAQAYFKHVTEHDDIPAELKERAHFNLGNTYAATKQLQHAIDEYEKVLDLNPDNQAAQDNLRVVKEMIKQEEQKQKQEQEKQKKKDQQKKDQEQQDQKKDQKQNGQDQKSDSDKKDKDSQGQNDQDGQKDQPQDKQGDQDKSEKKPSDKGEQQGDQEPQDDDGSYGDQDDKNGDKNDQAKKSKQDNKETQEGERDKQPQGGLDDEQSQHKKEDKGEDEHGTEPSQDKSEKQLDAHHGTQDQQKKQGDQQGGTGLGEQEEKEMDPHEQWIAGIMKQQEKSDAQANKAFIRQAINKGGSRQHGQKNW